MEQRRLGKTDMVASVLGFGGSEIGYQRVSGRTVARLLGSALDAGLNVIDTAECYEDSEVLIGRALGPRRREFHLFTKCGHARGWGRADWRPAPLLASIERSLRRFETDYLDLIQLHSCSLNELRRGDAIAALARARDRGRVRYLGYSADGSAARYAVECGRFDTLQTSVSIADQEALCLRASSGGAARAGARSPMRRGRDRSDSGGEAEERGHPRRVEHRRHLVVRGTALEAARGVQHRGKQRQVSSRIEEDAGQTEGPVNCPVDVGPLLERLVPRRVRPRGRGPGPASDRLDDLDRDVPLSAETQHLLEVSPVALLLGHEKVVRQQHGVEVEAREAAPVHRGDRPAVTGHPDEAREPLLAGLDESLQRASRPHDLIPVVGVAQGVELDQVDVVDAQPLERAVDVLAGLAAGPHAGLGREEEVLPVARHPRPDSQLGVPVPRSRVDVIDPVPEAQG